MWGDIMQSVIDFMIQHSVVFAGLGVAILDFIFAIKSDWKSNGILHSIYVFFANMLGKKE